MCLRTMYRKRGQYGREWAAYPSAMFFSRRIRSALCMKTYFDIDMEKCHARICLNIALEFNLNMPALQRYVDDPDTVLAELSEFYMGASKDAVKMLVNSVLNRGTVGGWVCNQELWDLQESRNMLPKEAKKHIKYGGVVDKTVLDWLTDFKVGKRIMDKVKAHGNHPIITQFDENIRRLHQAMKDKYPDVFQAAIDLIRTDSELQAEYPDDESMQRKAFSDCLFEVERRLLHAIIDSLQTKGYRVDAKIHDGCHVRKHGEDPIPDSVVRQVETDVKNATGFDIRLKVKPFKDYGTPLIREDIDAVCDAIEPSEITGQVLKPRSADLDGTDERPAKKRRL